ncbi:AzlC family ABC transporter permease [Falsihalocynthiibacter sp. SS001]|uniref:AzlC family ABC transporter permease n=1 Tax=Falsihalocynthiibacter sp. SS001 TaxID=3349698 RepID=UPI0036D386D1
MPNSTTKSAFLRGLRDGSPFLLVGAPFAMLFGVVATEAGLDVLHVMSFSVLVIAGAAQFTAVSLMAEDAPTFIILATSLAVNLRMMMYSASMVPYIGKAPLWQRGFISYILIDQGYSVSISEFERNPKMTIPERIAFFTGSMALLTPVWYIFTYIGAKVGTGIPPEYALDFALPITFLAMVGPMLRTLAHVAAAAVSIVLSLTLNFMPAGTGLLLAAFVAMMVGARIELWLGRKKA